jgi:hypothetical protein
MKNNNVKHTRTMRGRRRRRRRRRKIRFRTIVCEPPQ